jgi:hypothetical protein
MDVKTSGRIPVACREIGKHFSNAKLAWSASLRALAGRGPQVAYPVVLVEEEGITRADLFAWGIGCFAAHGITHIDQLLTDNVWPRTRCANCAPSLASGRSSSARTTHGITPRVELFNRTLLDE